MNSPRVLAFRHVPFEGAGRIAAALAARGIALEYADLYAGGARLPDAREFAGLIFLGGPMSVNDPLPWLAVEIRVILEAVERGQPVLGICLGSQLIAKALGSRVYANPVKEIGWFDLHFGDVAKQDRLLCGVSPVETVFHWHGETFDLPPRAVRLASSDRCANQAFRVGNGTYGFQFHLEVTPEMIADWCAQDVNCGDVKELDTPLNPDRNSARLSELSDVVFGNWCELLETSQCGKNTG